MELANLLVNNFVVLAVCHEAGKGLFADGTSLVVTVISLEVVSKVLLSWKRLRAEVALKHSVDFVVESFQRNVLLDTDCVIPVAALQMSVQFGSVRKTTTACGAPNGRWNIVMAIQMNIQRISCCIKAIWTGVIGAGYFMIHMD